MREGVIDNRKLTPYRGLDEVLIDYAHTSRAVLGDNFVGLYLLGSLAIGDFDLTSDVDFMIVTNSELSRGQVELVQSAHTKLIARDSRWVRHLEYSIFPLQRLSEKSSPYGPHGRDDSAARQLWYFNNGGSAIERSDHDNTLVTRWTLRYRSKAVLGPEPAAFAPEVTSDELRQEIRNSMLGWEKLFTPDSPYNNRFHQVFFVLNNCR
ncbi:MAG TPA: nucleotidyltransferase domain-containing protein, partial [Propionibacteriaceae bacterium]|nr:nucleotidyltransferase domain-containing protein [Propionibacteriaceae bacterium]